MIPRCVYQRVRVRSTGRQSGRESADCLVGRGRLGEEISTILKSTLLEPVIRFPEKTGLGPANTTPAKIHPRRPPSGGGRPRHTAAQRTRGPGGTLMGTNKKDSSCLWSSGVRGARPEAPRAPAPARTQTGHLYSELLGSECGRWAIINTGDTAIGVTALISQYSVTENFEFTWKYSFSFIPPF